MIAFLKESNVFFEIALFFNEAFDFTRFNDVKGISFVSLVEHKIIFFQLSWLQTINQLHFFVLVQHS